MSVPAIAPDQPTVIAGYALAISRALEHSGVDARKVLRAAGLTEAVSNDPLQRMASSQVAALFRVCVEATGDPYFGLTVGRFIHASNVGSKALQCGQLYQKNSITSTFPGGALTGAALSSETYSAPSCGALGWAKAAPDWSAPTEIKPVAASEKSRRFMNVLFC